MAHPEPAGIIPASETPREGQQLRLDAANAKGGGSALSRWYVQWSLAPADIASRIAGIGACIDALSTVPDGPGQIRFFPRS